MTIDFLSLPQNALEKIYSFSKDRSLVRLRELSKSLKDAIDRSILNAKRTEVHLFDIRKVNGNNAARISLTFQNRRDFAMWKSSFDIALSKVSNKGYEVNINTLFSAVLNPVELIRLLQYLKPLSGLAKFTTVNMSYHNRGIIKTCSELFVEKFVLRIPNANSADLTLYFDLIRKSRLVLLDFSSLSKETVEVLLQIADIAKCIGIKVTSRGDSSIKVSPLIRGILSRKCSSLIFENGANPLSEVETEQLIKIVHYIPKKVNISAFTEAQPVELNIGNYQVKILASHIGKEMILMHF